MVRLQMLVLIFLLGRAVDGKVFSVLAKSMLSAGFGFLLVVGIMEYGLSLIHIYLPYLDGGGFCRHGNRRFQGCRGADQKAVQGLCLSLIHI